MWKPASGGAVLAALILLTVLAGPLEAQMDRYEEQTGVSAKARDLLHKAQKLEKDGHAEEAIKAYQAAIRLEPNYIEAYQQMALALASQNRYPDAVKAFKEVVRLQPRIGHGPGQPGRGLYENGQLREARDAFRAAVRLRPDDAENHYNLGWPWASSSGTRRPYRSSPRPSNCSPNMARGPPQPGLGLL